MQEHSLTESAALVQIIKQFFEGAQGSQDSLTAIATLQTEVVQLQRRLAVIEEAIAKGKHRTGTPSKTASVAPPKSGHIHALTPIELAKRLGVSPDTILAEAFKGDAHFKAWTKRRDPASKMWQREGDFFHPLSE